MSTPDPSNLTKPKRKNLSSVLLLVVLAIAAWGFNWWQQTHNSPARAHINAGIKYLEQGQGAAAESEWKQAVQLDNRSVEAWEFLANYNMAANNWDTARAAWERVLELNPDTPQIHYYLATCNNKLNNKVAARQNAEAQLKIDPNHIGALDILTQVMDSNTDQKMRIKHLRHLVELQPENTDYMGRLAEDLVSDKQYEEASPLLDKLIKLKPELWPAYSLRGAALLYLASSPQELQRALADLKKALSYDPSDAVALLFIGKAYLKLQKPREAIAYLQRLDNLPTAHISYLFELSKAYQMQGDSKKARALREQYAALEQQSVQVKRLENRLSKQPNDFDALLELGMLLLNSRKPVGAAENINQALALRPKDPRAKNASAQLEKVYSQYLNAALKAIQKRDFDKIGSNLGRAMMIRPSDRRTAQALQQFQMIAPEDSVSPVPATP